MSQSTLDNDELFGEAASEMRDDVEASLADARAELPDSESVWEAQGDNVLGVLNGLRSALDVGAATDHLRDAKKWFTMGQRADAFDDAEDLEESIEEVEELIETIEDANEQVGELTAAIPDLKSTLEDAESDEDTDEE